MKKNSFKTLLLSGFAALVCASSYGQDRVAQKVNGDNGQPSLVVFSKDASYSMQDVNTVLAEQLKTRNSDSFTQIKSETDDIGFLHQKYQQHYNGIPVEFATYTFHGKNGKVVSISGEYYELDGINVTPTLNKEQGFQSAINHIGAQSYLWENVTAANQMDYTKPQGELVLLPNLSAQGKDASKNAQLAYKYDIYATQPVGRGEIYIDAITGEVLFYNSIIKHLDEHANASKNLISVENNNKSSKVSAFRATANAATRYSGTQTITTRVVGSSYALRDNTRGGGVNTYNSGRQDSYPSTNFTDADNNWTAAEFNNSNKDNAALDAHWGAEKTYDYLSSVHGRNSYNGSGAAINSWVHYDDIPGGLGYDNAFWNGSVMTYGDGTSTGAEGNGNFDALTSLDVAAHEIGHAVTSSTANLAYQRESGGLNEGFSDIWGAAVEHFAKGNGNNASPSADTWLIGDEIDRRNGSSALRSMSNPNSRNQPDTYGGTFWQNPNCGTPVRANDYCGVHTNSGVLNYWFYLSVAGGNGTNDIGSAFSVSGIGMTKSAKIAYRTLTQYLSSNSTFANARAGAIQSAIDLYGAGGVEEVGVTNAWHAVGVGAAYPTGGGGASYCTSTSSNTNDEYISRVQLNTINNTSGAQNYSDFTSIATTLAKGTSYTVTVTPTWTGTKYDEAISVWIDYNDDKDFDDAGEQIGTVAPNQNTTSSITFTVPNTASATATRMRVSMQYNAVPTACQSFTYGEVEDYTINIGGTAVDTQAPSNPTNLSASNATQTTVDLSWTASTDNVGVTGYDIYSGATNIGTVAGTTANITGLTANTSFSFRVKAKDAEDNASGFSNTATGTTLAEASSGGCTGGISSFPYSESFESGLGSWSQASGDDIDWTRDSSGTPSSNTGPSSGSAGSWYLFVEASSPNNPNKSAILNSPCFNLSSVSTAVFSFDYHMYGANNLGSVAVEASSNNGSSWASIWNASGTSQGNTWQSVNLDLSAYVGGVVQLRFVRVTGDTWQADIAIDNVKLLNSTATADPCSGVSEYNSSTSYSTGDRVTYQGNLFERTASSWTNLGACGATATLLAQDVNYPPNAIEISLYPNPVKGDMLYVKSSIENLPFTIVNMLGQQVAKGASTNGVNVAKLEAGLYMIQFNVNNTLETRKFIKQ
ncbi:M4 family metallopeptidase [Lacinutrix mariniflava]|uniref:M4 family metallopeptidase n=1 Tax=Lacinutrix mariniflava TaxID=342955 RepID=UPI0006E1B78A|nr:M4 family metallopeptidase [Lacinutrix mariniflava]